MKKRFLAFQLILLVAPLTAYYPAYAALTCTQRSSACAGLSFYVSPEAASRCWSNYHQACPNPPQISPACSILVSNITNCTVTSLPASMTTLQPLTDGLQTCIKQNIAQLKKVC